MVPIGHKRDVAHETTALIREAIARVPLPKLDEIPGEDEMAARITAGKSKVYRIPNTPFEIAYTESGPDTGRYQFTYRSVSQARDFYEEIKAYPFQPEQADIKGLYEAYFLSPGWLIPHEWIELLPGWLQFEFLGNRIWQFLVVFVSVLFSAFGIILLHGLIKHVSRNWKPLNRNLFFLLRPLVSIILVIFFEWFFIHQVRVTGEVARVVEFVKHLIILFASVVITMVIGSVLAEIIVSTRRFEHQQLDMQLTRLIVRLVSIVIAVVIVIVEMQKLGFSLATLLAGASVGGLAVGLAAQDTLKNIFGGIELSLDKPFTIGQRVKIKGYEGEIEEIGLRSTKIRTRSGNQITIPNQDAAKLDIENIDRRPFIRRKFNITITYDTPPEKITRAIELLKKILALPQVQGVATNVSDAKSSIEYRPHPNEAINQADFPPLVYFNDLNADSLNLLVYYWYHPPRLWDYLEHATWINTQIIERFNAEGIDFAFPTQTLHLADDEKKPLTIGYRKNSKEDISVGNAGSD
jgi:MscS family membrane protein